MDRTWARHAVPLQRARKSMVSTGRKTASGIRLCNGSVEAGGIRLCNIMRFERPAGRFCFNTASGIRLCNV